MDPGFDTRSSQSRHASSTCAAPASVERRSREALHNAFKVSPPLPINVHKATRSGGRSKMKLGWGVVRQHEDAMYLVQNDLVVKETNPVCEFKLMEFREIMAPLPKRSIFGTCFKTRRPLVRATGLGFDCSYICLEWQGSPISGGRANDSVLVRGDFSLVTRLHRRENL
jgi:hypothetical protein